MLAESEASRQASPAVGLVAKTVGSNGKQKITNMPLWLMYVAMKKGVVVKDEVTCNKIYS
jgi:hypothetical protein